jgi:molybdopterin synthase sulfur carrier subunit
MIKIIFFSKYREQFGEDSIEFPLEKSLPLKDLVFLIKEHYGDRAAFLADSKLICSVNQHVERADHMVNKGDIVAFYPPVTGG